MRTSRRNFIKATTLTGVGVTLTGLGINVPNVYAAGRRFKLDGSKEYTSVCTFCACGCGMLCHVKNGKLINLEGDPDHIVSEGSLCSKGASMSVLPNSNERVTTPMYRAPGTSTWKRITWNEALDRAAKRIKEVRDANWIEKETVNGVEYAVNRCDAIGMIGSAQVNNEECYLLTKLARLTGVVFLEHQARLCHSSSVPALSAAFGRGAMTNTWNDMKNAKVILIEGSNAAENHPMSAKWIMRAKDNGATVIHVDPRFSRTSKISDIHAQIRPGTDIAFLGSIINYVIENDLCDKGFIRAHTNAYHLVNRDFNFEEGLFSGYDENARRYDTASWAYQLDSAGKPLKTDDLNHPDSVYSKMKEFYQRYSFKTASDITGIPEDQIINIAQTYVNNKPGMIIYALGMTQHTVGVQNIRSFTVLQLLLGNSGKPGTGINALRGEANVQGSTDFALLFNYLPGYLSCPNHNQPTMQSWQNTNGYFRAKFFISLMKSWFGDNATPENGYAFEYLPKKNGNQNYSIYRIFETAIEKNMKLLWVSGQNPMVTNPNLNVVHKGLSNLETLIVSDLFMTETAAFWERPGTNPADINTEVIFLPAASFLEKEGCLTNSARLAQWRYTGIGPAGDSKSDLDIADLMFNRLRNLYRSSDLYKDRVFKLAKWDYPADNKAEAVLKEINGYDLATGKRLNGIGEIKADGTTACGNWIYAGIFPERGNLTKRRDNRTDNGGLGIFPEYAWTWPGNIHILSNRASADAAGVPFDENNKLVWWDAALGRWTGYDVPDVGSAADGPDTPGGQKPFRMTAEGVGRLFAPVYRDYDGAGLRDTSVVASDGPFPEFYEPVESPTDNVLHPSVQYNPCLIYPRISNMQPIGNYADFPYVLCTSSITEHWCGGAQTRNVPWLNELVKETYIEMPRALAEKLNIQDGGAVKVRSARGEVAVRTMITDRLHTLTINGKEVTVVWMPYNWGFKGLSTAASTNLLTIDAGDPNTWIQETKACLVDIQKA